MTGIRSFHPINWAKAGFLTGAMAIALTLTPLAARAQSTEIPAPWLEAIEQLNLTTDQQAQLADIRRNTQTQLEQILTSQQQEQLRLVREQRSAMRDAIAAMDLSADQRTQLRQIFQSSRQAASEVLTPDQRQQVRTGLQNQRGLHNGRGHRSRMAP